MHTSFAPCAGPSWHSLPMLAARVPVLASCTPKHLLTPCSVPCSMAAAMRCCSRRRVAACWVGAMGLGMADLSVQGLEFLVLGSVIIAGLASLPQTDSADFAEGLSSRLLGVREEEPVDTETKVRNPVTGRLIRHDGPTYRRLVKQGIVVEGEETFEGERAGLSLRAIYEKTVEGDAQGIMPREGSVAILHYCCRLYSKQGPMFGTSLAIPASSTAARSSTTKLSVDGSPLPFVFEVGDTLVIRALNEVVVKMKEGEHGVLTIPPHLGFNAKRREPQPASRSGKQMLARALDGDQPITVVMELHLIRVLPIPPHVMLSRIGGSGEEGRGGGLARYSPEELQAMLKESGDGEYFLSI